MVESQRQGSNIHEIYERALGVLLNDYTRNFPENAAAFHETFFDRGQEVNRFQGLLEGKESLDQTVIVTGKAGVGKTSFVYRLAFADKANVDLEIAPIVADYRAAIPQSDIGCVMGFVESAKKRFAELGFPIEELKNNNQDNLQENVRVIYAHIERVVKDHASIPRIVIFLDDFDYAEDVLFKLLDYFLPFAQCAYCTVVISMRPPLRAAIDTYDDRIRFYFGKNVHELKLEPMAAREVIASRLAPILINRESESILKSIIDRFHKRGPLNKVIKEFGIDSIDDLGKIDFPFTEKHNDFMHRISNGNLREVMDIAFDSLLFIIREGDRLEERMEKGFPRRVIGKPNVVRLFYTDDKSRYKMININEYKSKSGNSLLYNTIEAIKINRRVDETLYAMLGTLGHSEDKVTWAIEHLADKTQRLLEPKWILPPHRAGIIHRYEEYEVTEKGHYYLDIAKWEEYREEAGEVGTSLFDSLKP